MSRNQEPDFKKKIVCLHLEEGRTLKGLQKEYGVLKPVSLSGFKQLRIECQSNEQAKEDYDYMQENLRLQRELAEMQKENDFLKKQKYPSESPYRAKVQEQGNLASVYCEKK